MELHSLVEYKLATIHIENIHAILAALDASIKALTPYQHYTPVAHSLEELKNNRSVLISHLKQQRDIVEQKGLK